MPDADIINEIEQIRVDNNRLWMNLLRIAMTHNAAGTKEILKGISENDKKIFSLTETLANA